MAKFNKLLKLKRIHIGYTLPTAKGMSIKSWWVIAGSARKTYFSGRLSVEEIRKLGEFLAKNGYEQKIIDSGLGYYKEVWVRK